MLALLYEQDKAICLTALGQTLREWLPFLSERNVHTLGLYVARSLAAYQLRNPTTWGKKYAPSVEVFPFQFIWRAMLKLDDKLSSDELNREIFRVTNAEGLEEAIDRIRFSRQEANVALMSDPVLTGTSVNDRIIPWMSMASFGYTLISEKDSEGFYSINPRARSTLERFAFTTQKHRAFSSVPEYVQHIASMGGVPVTHPLNRNLEEQVGAH